MNIKHFRGLGKLHTGIPAPEPSEYDLFDAEAFFEEKELAMMKNHQSIDKRLFFDVAKIVLAHGGQAKGGQQ